MIKRFIQEEFEYLLQNFPAVGIIGPRQVGKTTLVKDYFRGSGHSHYLDLERHSDRSKLTEPELYLQSQTQKTVILDEIQFMPELFPLLRSLIDEERKPGRFIILGSASPSLLRQSSESLAGRIAYLQLRPFNLLEVRHEVSWQDLWVKGGFPEPLLKGHARFISRWQQNFIHNYIQRDLPSMGFPADPDTSYRLLQMLASANGGPLNFSELARSLGVSVPSAKTYFNFFDNAFLVYRLKPWRSNLKKRWVKTPRIFFSDTGMLHHLMGIGQYNTLIGHIAAGASWENFVINQIRSVLQPDDECYYYRTQDGAEIDLLVRRNNQWLFGAEIKFSNAPVLTKGSYLAMEDVELPKLYIISPETENYLLNENVEVISLMDFMERLVEWNQ